MTSARTDNLAVADGVAGAERQVVFDQPMAASMCGFPGVARGAELCDDAGLAKGGAGARTLASWR